MIGRIGSWRLVTGPALGALVVVLGASWPWGVLIAIAMTVAVVMLPRRTGRVTAGRLDPFTLSEPWRRHVAGAQRAAREIDATVAGASPGPLTDRLAQIAGQIDTALADACQIAQRGDDLDAAIARLDRTALRSRLETLRDRHPVVHDDDVAATINSLEAQLATIDRLTQQSEQAAITLRLTQTRLDELAARSTEIALGSGDTDAWEHDVDDLVVELEAIRLAMDELDSP
jgi:hypothetical protein